MKKNNFFRFNFIILLLMGVALPSVSFAQGTVFCELASDPKFDTLVNYITCLITSAIVPLLFTLAFALFIWGVIQYTLNNTEEAKRQKGKQFMLWGIIALTVMFCVWGLVAILGNTFGIDTKLIPQVAD